MARLDDPVDAKQWLARADCFLYTVKLFERLPPQLMGVTAVVHILSYSFATELYFKVLAQLERETPPLEGHDLKKLFNDLSPATQKRLEKAWKRANRQNAKALKDAPAWAQIPPGFRAALDASARAFIEWRYGEKDEVQHWHLGGVADETREMILELQPEWRITEGPRGQLDPKPLLAERKRYEFRLPAGWAIRNHKAPTFKS